MEGGRDRKRKTRRKNEREEGRKEGKEGGRRREKQGKEGDKGWFCGIPFGKHGLCFLRSLPYKYLCWNALMCVTPRTKLGGDSGL